MLGGSHCGVQERVAGDVDPFEELERDMLDIMRDGTKSRKAVGSRLAAKK